MLTATFTEFRQHAKAYFDAVEKGETIHIIRHGKVIAEINPVESDEKLFSWKQPSLKMAIKGVSITKEILKARESSK